VQLTDSDFQLRNRLSAGHFPVLLGSLQRSPRFPGWIGEVFERGREEGREMGKGEGKDWGHKQAAPQIRLIHHFGGI